MAFDLRKFCNWRISNTKTYLFASLVLGSLLLGSSLAYPMLSLDKSICAPIAFVLFFLSGGVLQRPENPRNPAVNSRYGHLTVVVDIVAMVLILTCGHNTVEDHCRLLPVYCMASTFLTAAWPSLFENLGLEPKRVEDQFDPLVSPHAYTPMAGRQNETEFPHRTGARGSLPGWLEEQAQREDHNEQDHQDRQEGSSTHHSHQAHGQNEESLEKRLRSPTTPRELLLLHMGPYSSCSNDSEQTDSLSLSSRATMPSEMSENVMPLFQAEMTTRASQKAPRITTRRAEINALGGTFSARRDAGSPPLEFAVRRGQSL